MDDLNDEFMDKSIKNQQLILCLKTIDDFRLFFSPNKLKNEFSEFRQL